MSCIYYHRHSPSSLRFYVLGSDEPHRFDLQDEYMRSSMKHDFSNIVTLRNASDTGQILVNQVCYELSGLFAGLICS